MSDLHCPARLLLVRHADSSYESDLWSDAGGSLSALGRRQARDLAARLRVRRVMHVWTSTYARAVQTAEIVAARLDVDVTTREGLREFGVGDHAGEPMAEDPFATVFSAWLAGDLDRRVPGAESGREVVERCGQVLQEIADLHRGETVVVISHGGITRLTVDQLASFDRGVQPGRTPNTGLIDLEVDADGVRCVGWEHSLEA